MDFKTFQDFEAAGDDKAAFLQAFIDEHRQSRLASTARMADRYDRQLNDTIMNYVQTILTLSGNPIEDFTASNNRIASNFFNRLNTQRAMYSLGNGVTFADESTREKLGERFDQDIMDAGYYALIHGVTFCFWNVDRIHVFPVTEFAPLWDEDSGALRAGVRFWRLAPEKPMYAVLYEEDGYTKYRTEGDADEQLKVYEEKRPYIVRTRYTPADGSEAVIGEDNYSALPIVPLWGSRKRQSTLVGMRESIDSYDLIRSGFANDLTDCSQIYWIVENAGGMSDRDLARFRDRLKVTHIANADTSEGGKVTPYAQEIPYQARKEYLDMIRAGLYEDFGALDVHTVAAGATNDHIEAAYQPMDENAQDFERQVTECIKQILALQDIEDDPVYKRNRISNQAEQVTMVVQEAQWLDEETILRKLPNITPDEVEEILRRKDQEDMDRLSSGFGAQQDPQEEDVPQTGTEDEEEE